MQTDCYERGHTPGPHNVCVKCKRFLIYVGKHRVPHTQAELDRLWKGVDREATGSMEGGHGRCV